MNLCNYIISMELKMFEQIINVDRMEQAVSLFGSFDENVVLIEKTFGVKIHSRGSDKVGS